VGADVQGQMSSVGANVGIRAGETPPLASSDVTALRSQRRDDATSGGVGQRLKPSTIYHIIIVITFHSQEWTSVSIVCSLSHHLTSQPSVNSHQSSLSLYEEISCR